MALVDIGVQEMDDQTFAARLDQLQRRRAHLLFVQGVDDVAGRIHAFIDLDPELARHQRFERAGQAVGIRARAPAKLEDVAKTHRGDQADPGELFLQQGVGRRRGAMHDGIQPRGFRPRRRKRHHHAFGPVVHRGRNLRDRDFASLLIQHDKVGEGATDIATYNPHVIP